MGAAAIGLGVGSLIAGTAGTILTNRKNIALAQQGNEFNERMLDKQIAYNKEMYQQQLSDTLAYSDPSFIRGRVQEAGYNPNVIAGSQLGSVSSMPATQGVTTPQAHVPQVDYSGVSGSMLDAASLVQMQESVDAENRLKKEQADAIAVEKQFLAAKALADLANLRSTIQDRDTRRELDTVLKGLEADVKRVSITKTQEEVNLLRTQVKGQVLDNIASAKKLEFLDQQLKIDLANRAADLSLKRATESLTRSQVEHEIQKIAETTASTSLKNAQASGQRSQNQLFNRTYKERVKMIQEELHNTMYDTDKFGFMKTATRIAAQFGVDRGF